MLKGYSKYRRLSLPPHPSLPTPSLRAATGEKPARRVHRGNAKVRRHEAQCATRLSGCVGAENAAQSMRGYRKYNAYDMFYVLSFLV